MKVKGKFSPTLCQALKVLLCSIFRIEMDIQIETNTVSYLKSNNVLTVSGGPGEKP